MLGSWGSVEMTARTSSGAALSFFCKAPSIRAGPSRSGALRRIEHELTGRSRINQA